jgi:hypothetical protein
MQDLARIVRNTCRSPGADPATPTFPVVTTPSLEQRRAFDLLASITV